MDGRPMRASKWAANGAKNTGSSSSTSTRPNSAGNTNNADGKIASHNVGWSLTVLSTMASIPSSPRVRGHPPCSAPSDQGSTRRLFQVLVASGPRSRCRKTFTPASPRRLADLLRRTGRSVYAGVSEAGGTIGHVDYYYVYPWPVEIIN